VTMGDGSVFCAWREGATHIAKKRNSKEKAVGGNLKEWQSEINRWS